MSHQNMSSLNGTSDDQSLHSLCVPSCRRKGIRSSIQQHTQKLKNARHREMNSKMAVVMVGLSLCRASKLAS